MIHDKTPLHIVDPPRLDPQTLARPPELEPPGLALPRGTFAVLLRAIDPGDP